MKKMQKKVEVEVEKVEKVEVKSNRNFWDHLIGSQSDKIDQLVKKCLDEKKAIDATEITKLTGFSKSRVGVHLKHLRDRKLISSNK